MNRLLIFLIIVGVDFLTAQDIWASHWYVDNAAVGANNGRSWKDAWVSFNNIVWGTGGVKAGDTLFISGGVGSKTYTSTLNIKTSGEQGKPITIRSGQEPNHNGVVIIDMKNQDCAIIFDNRSYLVIDGEYRGERHFKLMNGGTSQAMSCLISGINNKHCVIKYIEAQTASSGFNFIYASDLEVAHCYLHDIRWEVGIDLDASSGQYDNNRIHHNIIELNVVAGYGNGPDGVQGTYGISCYNNIVRGVVGLPQLGAQHCDAFQLSGSYHKVYNNEIIDCTNAAISGDIGSNESEGNWMFYNNVYRITSAVRTIYGRLIDYNLYASCTVSNVLIANNSIIDSYDQPVIQIHIHNANVRLRNWTIKNNLFYNSGDLNTTIYIDNGSYTYGADNADVQLDYNLLYPGEYGGKQKIFFKDKEFIQPHGRSGKPAFVSYQKRNSIIDAHLTESDLAATDKGIDLSAFFKIDKDGNPRPEGAPWDIGAYENIPMLLPPQNFRFQK